MRNSQESTANFGSPTISAERWAELDWDSPPLRAFLEATANAEHQCVGIRLVPTDHNCLRGAVRCSCGHEIGFSGYQWLRRADGTRFYRFPPFHQWARRRALRHYSEVETAEAEPLTGDERRQLATLRRREAVSA